MAELLTSSDIIRERMGFGVSPLAAPETRRAYAEAGLSPLGTQERERFERGGRISPMASTPEKEAWVAAEVQAGRRPQTDLPTAYGGIGERPEATTRRGLRMQQEWDARHKMIIDQQEAIRQQEAAAREERRISIAEQAEQRQQWAQDTKEQRDAAILEQSGKIQSSIMGFTRPDGSKIRPININDPDAVERLQSVIYANRLGMEDQATKEVVFGLLDDARKVQETRSAQIQKQSEQQQSWLVGQQEEAASVGVDTSRFFTTKVDPETNQTVVTGVDQLGLSKAIGEAKRQDAERKKQEIASASVSEEIRGEAKDALKGIEEIDKQIREQNFMASRESGERARDEYLARAEYLRGEREVLTARFNNLIPKKQESVQPKTEVAQPQQKELSQQDQVALNWANANPDDPRSQKIKVKLGVQ